MLAEEVGVGWLGELHLGFSDSPVLVGGVDGEAVLFHLLHFFRITLSGADQVALLFVDAVWGPALAVDDFGVLESFVHVVGDGEGTVTFGGALLGLLDDIWEEFVTFWVGENDVGAITWKEVDDGLSDGEWLTIGWGVGPGHADLLTLETGFATKVLDDVDEVRHGLGWVVLVALQVEDSGTSVENFFFIGFLEILGNFGLVSMTFVDILIVSDGHYFRKEGNHGSGFSDGFTVGNLGLANVEFDWLETKECAGLEEGETSSGGVITEFADSDGTMEGGAIDVGLSELFKNHSSKICGIKLSLGHIPGT